MQHRPLTWLGLLWAFVPLAQAATLQVNVQDEQGRPLPDAVVFLESRDAARAVKPQEGVEVAQQNRAFVPGVQVVTRGSSVNFPNRDTVRHHVYSFSPTKKFELKLYIGTPASPVVFDQAGVVVLGCNIHDEMVGWILVMETPHYGRSAANGRVVLADVPEGSYRLRVWHSHLPVGVAASSQAQTVGAAGGTVTVQLKGLVP